jgi:hypothetical protein
VVFGRRALKQLILSQERGEAVAYLSMVIGWICAGLFMAGGVVALAIWLIEPEAI